IGRSLRHVHTARMLELLLRGRVCIRLKARSFKRLGCPVSVQTVQSKYLNNLVEQDHRFIKRRIRNMGGFGSFPSAAATLEGIEVANMIRKCQFGATGTSGFKQFAQFAE
ncbi:DDE-type integrase/transposase/recombinase, partial [Shimia gijangensis]|uniref:DDE-type integrase/transposase/recombinase n=1 Tax=Shimia gijangensis TaxID=1470563 RepID=UPI001FE47A5A